VRGRKRTREENEYARPQESRHEGLESATRTEECEGGKGCSGGRMQKDPAPIVRNNMPMRKRRRGDQLHAFFPIKRVTRVKRESSQQKKKGGRESGGFRPLALNCRPGKTAGACKREQRRGTGGRVGALEQEKL